MGYDRPNVAEEIQSRFKLICRLCNSENVVVNFEKGINYGGQTGYQEGTFSIGCNACKKNDFLKDL